MKTIHVKGTVAYPIYIDQDISVVDDASAESIKATVIDIAERFLDHGCVKPVFQGELIITEKK